jgi:hypothetical protein
MPAAFCLLPTALHCYPPPVTTNCTERCCPSTTLVVITAAVLAWPWTTRGLWDMLAFHAQRQHLGYMKAGRKPPGTDLMDIRSSCISWHERTVFGVTPGVVNPPCPLAKSQQMTRPASCAPSRAAGLCDADAAAAPGVCKKRPHLAYCGASACGQRLTAALTNGQSRHEIAGMTSNTTPCTGEVLKERGPQNL